MAATLHIATVQRIVRAHRNMRHVSVAAAQDEVVKLAMTAGTAIERSDDAALCVKLEQATGLSIGDLARVAAKWPIDG